MIRKVLGNEENKESLILQKCSNCSEGLGKQLCSSCNKCFCQDCIDKGIITKLQEKAPLGINGGCFNANTIEQQYLRKYILDEGLSFSNVYKDLLNDLEGKKYFFLLNYRIVLKSERQFRREDELCEPCFAELWNELLYKYRVSIANSLPREIRRRPNCWYGNECRTQTYNIEHARRFNHICDKVDSN